MTKSALAVALLAVVGALLWFTLFDRPSKSSGPIVSTGGLAEEDRSGPSTKEPLLEVDAKSGILGSVDASGVVEELAESWLPKRPYERIAGLRAGTVLADFLGPDYERLAPRLEKILKQSDPLGLDGILEFPENEAIGDPVDCLEDIKAVWLREIQPGYGFIPYPYLMQVPDCFLGITDGGRLLDSMLRSRRFNPDLDSKDRSAAEFAALRSDLNQELGLLSSMVADLIGAERQFVESDLAEADTQHPPRYGTILFSPVVGIPEPLVTGDSSSGLNWQWFCYMGGVGSASTRCGLLAATYTLDLRSIPEIVALIEGVITFKEDLAHRMSLRVPLLPNRL